MREGGVPTRHNRVVFGWRTRQLEELNGMMVCAHDVDRRRRWDNRLSVPVVKQQIGMSAVLLSPTRSGAGCSRQDGSGRGPDTGKKKESGVGQFEDALNETILQSRPEPEDRLSHNIESRKIRTKIGRLGVPSLAAARTSYLQGDPPTATLPVRLNRPITNSYQKRATIAISPHKTVLITPVFTRAKRTSFLVYLAIYRKMKSFGVPDTVGIITTPPYQKLELGLALIRGQVTI